MKVLILGASYGSLLGTKLVMAGHDVTLVCQAPTAELINKHGTTIRMTLRGEAEPRLIHSGDYEGNLDAAAPDDVDVSQYQLAALAMQEPQYGAPAVATLLQRVAESGLPAMSIMNMPPLPYLKRLPGLDAALLEDCYADPKVWDKFDPGRVTLCSPDPQAYRVPEQPANFLHVGLPTNFKSAAFDDPRHTAMLEQLERDIAAIRLDGQDVPVKLKVHESLFVPLAKWSMLLTGNYRCVLANGAQAIKDAVHSDLDQSRQIYSWVDQLARDMGADPADQVPFDKYARAAEGLLKPSSAARAIEAGARHIERVDKLVQSIARQRGISLDLIDQVVATVDARLAENRSA